MSAAVFDLSNKQIVKTEHATCDTYMGCLDELLAAGIVQAELLPMGRSTTISWSHGQQIKTRCVIDPTYVRICLDKKSDVAWVSIGLSVEMQQTRKTAERARLAKAVVKARVVDLDAEVAASKVAAKRLAEIPRSGAAFLRSEAQSLRDFIVVLTNGASVGSKNHGFRLASESLDDIHCQIDALVEAVLNAQVQFDPDHHAQAISDAERKVLYAGPYMHGRLSALCHPNPSLIAGERA